MELSLLIPQELKIRWDDRGLVLYFYIRRSNMAPATPTPSGPVPVQGPHPSFIQVAKPYLFHQQVQGQLIAIGTNPTREDAFRLQGVQWISDVRAALQL
jgi:hypothetical protein